MFELSVWYVILSHRHGLPLTIEEFDIEANYDDEGDDVYEVDEKTDTTGCPKTSTRYW